MSRALLLLLVLVLPSSVQAQDAEATLRVFLDCQFYCDNQFIRDELPIVDFVTEPRSADVHVLYAQQTTGSGGELVTLTFLGRRAYAAVSDTLTYPVEPSATNDDKRRGLLHHMAIGLTRYLAHAGLTDRIEVVAVKPQQGEEPAGSIETDPWNYWAFSIRGSGSLNGEASTKFIQRRGSFSANRTTEDLKVRISANINESSSEFDTGDEVIESSTSSERLSGQLVKSIGPQWSVGGTARLSSSSFQNTKLEMEVGPAIEYDFFPYSMSTRKLLTLQYGVYLSQRQYDQLTIFALDEETILRHSLELSLSLAQKWGSVSLSTDLSHLLTNFDRSLLESYNLGFFGSANVRLFRGLSVNAFASYNRIRDQLDLPGDAATREEILLRSVQLPTGYSYYINFGLTYRFGSIFNNVVNPRMGGGGGGGIVIIG